ncbi:MAG: lipid A deacylase LpxR family protein [Henriciella sp.]
MNNPQITALDLARLCLIAATSVIAAPTAIAQTSETVVFNIENDLFTGSDNNYTNGLSVTWSSDEVGKYRSGSFVSNIANTMDFLPGFNNGTSTDHISFSLISEMNTPSRIDLVDPLLDDQPYSGILLLSTGFYTDHGDWTQAWDIKLGAVGPITQTDHVQIEFHELIGAEEPLGWDAQLPNEAILNVGYLAGRTLYEGSTAIGNEWRAVGLANASLGNYQTAAGGGLILELGNDLDKTLSTASLGQGFGSIVGLGTSPTPDLKYTVYAGVGANAVGHFLPLDGTVFRGSRSVDYDPLAAFFSAGATLRYGRMIASFGISRGATPFDDTEDETDYGAISIGWQY